METFKKFITDAYSLIPSFPLIINPNEFNPPLKREEPNLYIFPMIKPNFSFDIECIKFQAYLKFKGINHQLNTNLDYNASPNQKLPFLISKNRNALAGLDIKIYADSETKLANTIELEDNKAFIALTESKLDTALIYNDANICLEALSIRLGESKFFNGEFPCYIDAVVFSYLHTILSVLSKPNLDHSLLELISKYENLLNFTERIWVDYFKN
ncbi:hypothetical protein HDU92_005698 [Lobulomyces angularis]|nr:hypothetical protein HDU92_005698 [Lobulomyces angularis]